MPILRQEPLTGEWVIVATERARRPETFAPEKKEKKAPLPVRMEDCPFCPGNEHLTPPEVLAYRGDFKQDAGAGDSDVPGWSVRIIPNKFPALEQRRDGDHLDDRQNHKWNFFQDFTGYGVHEVIIETPDHNRQLADLSVDELALVLRSFKERLLSLEEDPRLKYVQIFRNHRREAGASIEHPHGQLIALPYIPPLLEKEYQRSREYYDENGRCLLCTLLDEEEKRGERVVLSNESFLAYIPFAAQLPFTTWIVPRQHVSSMEKGPEGWEERMAPLLKNFLIQLRDKLDDPPYNFYFHLAPLRERARPDYHWHLEIIPKLTIVAGLEMATGTYINVSRPEEAAQFLRE